MEFKIISWERCTVKQPSKTESILYEALGEGKEVDYLSIERGCVICKLREVPIEAFKNLNQKNRNTDSLNVYRRAEQSKSKQTLVQIVTGTK